MVAVSSMAERCLTTKLSHPGPKDKTRDSGTESANPGWLQRLVSRRNVSLTHAFKVMKGMTDATTTAHTRTAAARNRVPAKRKTAEGVGSLRSVRTREY